MTKKPFRVLTLDGGGMRGLYTATKLLGLAQRFNSSFKEKTPDIGKSFDLICGTSTGAILACGLASGISIHKISDLYIKKGKDIFTSPTPNTGTTLEKTKFAFWSYNHVNKPTAQADVLKNELDKCFGKTTLKDVYSNRNIALCIPSVDARNSKAWVFKTPHIPDKTRDDNYKLADVCMASASAPILFPINQQCNPDIPIEKQSFVDGGLWANNPIMIGLIEALSMAKENQSIQVLSVGTCDTPNGDPNKARDPDWGIYKWKAGINIVESSLAAQSFGYSNMARFLANHMTSKDREIKVVRLEETAKSPEQYSAIGLDKADDLAINTLIEMAAIDASNIHSKSLNPGDNEYSFLKNLFLSMEELEVK
ncbi:MAG: hypothetical protein DKM50_04305 [Candidatus Margulisiibacteriota bacterium]|nr:MAG: hypothetical protein DKM50_04305 [Candidatus Margulisiibacteriota bacterium]